MIRLRDATTLALTKLRTRKVRLVVTLVVSSLLFGVLAAASIVSRGAFDSVERFGKEGLSSRFIASGNPNYGEYDIFTNNQIMDRAQALFDDQVKQKKAEAKRLGITYESANEPSPVQSYGAGTSKTRNLNVDHPLAKQAINEYLAAKPKHGTSEEFQAAAQKYDSKHFYESQFRGYTMDAQLKVLKAGKEEFGNPKPGGFNGPPSGTDSFVNMWSLMSSDLLKSFTLPGQSLGLGSDGSVPMVVPIKAAEQLLQLPSLPRSASPDAQLDRLKTVRQKAANLRFEVCYRNATSAALVDKAVQQQQDYTNSAAIKGYQRPDLMYDVPKEACGTPVVVRDVRTKDQKILDAKQQEFDQKFGAEPTRQQILKFRVVGVTPDVDYGPSTSTTQIIQSLVYSSLGPSWFAPSEVARADPLIQQLFTPTDPTTSGKTFFAEFATANQAKKFLDQQACNPDYSKAPTGPSGPYKKCADQGHFFSLSAFGSNSVGLENTRHTFGRLFGLAALGVAVIACIIMMGTVGKMIADSRRETAVFRAIGAKKIDIAQIYLLYTIFLSILITVFAVLLGYIAASFIHGRFSERITVQALLAYNAQNLGMHFNLYSFYWLDMLKLLGAAVGAGLVSAFFPLLRNLRRNPMRDMRDDT